MAKCVLHLGVTIFTRYQHPKNNLPEFSFLNRTSSLYPCRRQPNRKIFCKILVKVNIEPLVWHFHARQFQGLDRQFENLGFQLLGQDKSPYLWLSQLQPVLYECEPSIPAPST